MLKKSPGGLVYIGNYKNGRIEPGMEHLVRLHVILYITKRLHVNIPYVHARAVGMYISLYFAGLFFWWDVCTSIKTHC